MKLDKVDLYFILPGMVHDAVLMWGYGVNKTVEQGHNPSDGIKVSENIFNLIFDGITGIVAINHQGDRKPNYRVEIFQKDELLTLMTWNPAKEVMVKNYKPNEENDWSGLMWPGLVTEVCLLKYLITINLTIP